MQQLELKVTGRVQGVGFRFFAQGKANQLGITGWARNTPDGGVEILAEGERKELENFVDWIKLGPPLSRVAHVTRNASEKTTGFKEFTIRY